MWSFYTTDVYDIHIYLLNYTQELHFYSDIYICIDMMMGMVREDILFTVFENAYSTREK